MYKVIKGEHFDTIERTDEDGKVWSIPTDPANSDYQEYLNPAKEAPFTK
jgi:hypothetical protein